MKRLLAVVLAAFTLLGCRSSGEATDPFFGRTTIEPPRTGSVPGQSEPYYQPPNVAGSQPGAPLRPIPAPQSSLAAPAGAVNLATPAPNPGPYPAPNTRYVTPAANPNPPPNPPPNPSNNFQYQNYNNNPGVPVNTTGWRGATTAAPAACRPANCVPACPSAPTYACPPGTVPVAAQPVCNAAPCAAQAPTLATRATPPAPLYSYPPPPADGSTARLASRPEANRGGSFPPRYDTANASSPYGNPSAAPAGRNPGQPIDITELPEHTDRSSSTRPPPTGAAVNPLGTAPDSPDTSKVLQAAAIVPSADGNRVSAASRQTDYAHDSNYQSLRGRLEYSPLEKVWKLRITPVDGGAIGHGDSVVISNPSVLIGYERGDWIEARGRLSAQNPTDQGTAPLYEVVDIQRVGA